MQEISSGRPELSWYSEGLHFECTRCGACCTGAPGFVWVDSEQIAQLAEYRGQTVETFARRFVRQVGERYSLIERPNGDCIFWDRQAGCTVYPARPEQCRTWPFWRENLVTRDEWAATAQRCPGVGEGRWFSVEEIEAAARRSPG